MNQRIAIFANPIAGRGLGRELALRMRDRLLLDGHDARPFFERPDRMAPADLANFDAAIAIGGDGTLRSVAQLLTDFGRHPGPGILAMPLGTANLMARHLSLPLGTANREDRAAAAIAARKHVLVDAGVLTGPGLRQMFLLMAGIGLDGQIVHRLAQIRKGPISFMSYIMPTAITAFTYQFPAIEVEADGQVIWPLNPAIAFVGNIAEYGTGFHLLPRAHSSDGKLDVMVLPANRLAELVGHTLRIFAGEQIHGEGVIYRQARQIAVRSQAPVEVQADGDPAGTTPIQTQLLPSRVALIVPAA